MKKITFLTMFLALLFLPIQLLGQEYTPLQVTTGFNSDVIAEAAPASETTTASVDAPNGGANFAFMTTAYPGATGGLPVNGLITSVAIPELAFQLADYTGNNSLKINENGGTGTLVFGNQQAALKLFILVTSGSATSTFTGVIHFSDNTTQVITSQSVSDWYQTGTVAIQGIGRVGRTGNNVENNATNPKIFQIAIPILTENSLKTIVSIDFTKTSSNSGYLNIFGVSAEITPACPKPTNVSVTNVSNSTATVSWIETSFPNALGYSYEVRTSGVPGSEGSVFSGSTSLNEAQLGNLLPNTLYQIYVKANCLLDSESNWTLAVNFTTLCSSITDLPYEENFETYGTGSDAFPSCWLRPVTYTSGSVWPSIVTYESGNRLRFQSAVGTPTYAVSPSFFEDINNVRVEFKLKREGPNSGTIDIGVMSDPLDLSTFELVQTINPSNSTFNDYVFNLDATVLSGGGNYVAFRHNSNASSWYYWLDDFRVELLPSCVEPSSLAVSNINANSANLLWASGGSNFDVEIMLSTATATGVPTSTGISNSFVVDDLLAATTYKYYVRQNCGEGDVSVWVGPFSFTTACNPPVNATGMTFTDVTAAATKINYTAADPVPSGYVIFRSTSEIPPVLTTGTTYSTSQTTAVSSLTTENEDTYFCVYNGTALSGTASSLTSNTNYHYYVFARSSENSCSGAPWYSEEELTGSKVTLPAAPTSAVVSGLTNSTATLSWTASVVGGGAGVVSYTLEVCTDSGYTTPIAGSPFSMGTNVSQALTGLATSTQYYYRIKANNTFGDSTYLTGNFTTTQVPATLNFVEDFEGTIGWTLNNGTQTNRWYVGSAVSTGVGTKSLYISNNNGDANVYTTNSASVVQAYRDIAVPLGTSDASISFDWKGMGEDTNTAYDYFRVWLVPATFVPSSGSQISSGSGRIQIGSNFYRQTAWQHYENTELNLSSFAGEVVRVVFEWKNDGSSGTTNAAAIDNVEINIPNCPKPLDLSVPGFTYEDATLEWESTGESFDVKWGIAGFDLETEGTLEVDFENGGTLTDLVANTTYEYYVRLKCDEGEVSLWSEPYAFYTGYCVPSTSGTYFIKEVKTRQAITDIFNATPTKAPNGYGDYSDTDVLVAYAGQEVEVSIAANSGTHYFFMWIDMNNDLVFDNSTEKIIDTSSGYASEYNGTITIPNLSVGDYRVRFGNSFSGLITPCGTASGEYEDYTLRVINTPTCFAPINIQVRTVDKNSAEVAWEVPDMGNTPEDGYVIEIRTAGNPGDAVGFVSSVNAAALSTILTGLEASTDYTFYVKSLCTEEDDESYWSQGISFTTLCDYPDLINNEGGTICGVGTTSLSVSFEDNSNVKWYSTETSDEVLFIGTEFETPILDETTSYWVSATGGDIVEGYGGKMSPNAGSTGSSFSDWGIVFNATEDIKLVSTDIYSTSNGTINVKVMNPSGQQIYETGNINIIAGGTTTPNVIPLNLNLPVGVGYKILVKSYSGASLIRDSSITGFPYSDGEGILTATASEWGGTTTGNYYYFYNLKYEIACVSPREEVIVTVAPTSAIEDVTISHTTGDTARVNIDSEGTLFAIEYGETGFEHGDGILIEDATNIHTLIDLTDDMDYDVYVKNTCGAWFGPVTFTSINIAMPQTITVEDVVKTYGDAPFINGSSDSGLELSYVVADPTVLNVVDGELVIVGGGTTTVVASQEGTENFLVAEEVTFSVTVNKTPLTVTVEDNEKVYDGVAYSSGTLSYEGFVYQDDATDLSGDAVFSGTGFGAVNVGVYEVEVSGLISDNYIISYEPGALEIVKATLGGIDFEDQMVIYDGSEKSILISGVLPSGVVVTYENNDQVEAGDYVVIASIDGGINYNDLELEALMKIRKSLAAVVFEDAVLVYTGSPQSILVSDNVPTGVTVTYSNNAKTDVGVYEVVATLDGGEVYENASLTATMTIKKATLEGILTFEDGRFTYDGLEKSIFVGGNIPAGVTITYHNNERVDVGVYEVVAEISGGPSYEDLELIAELDIVKASLAGLITLNNQTYVYDGSPRSLIITGELPIGVVAHYENNLHTDAGVYQVLVSLSGGHNFEDFELVAVLTITKADLSGMIAFTGATFGYDGTEKTIVLTGTLPEGASVTYSNNAKTEIGIYEATANIEGGINYNDATLSATLTIIEGSITSVQFYDQVFEYDGTEKSIYITGTIPEGARVSYVNNGQTEIGAYVVRAIISGNDLYNDLELTATLTIKKRSLDGITFVGNTFVYDGSPKSIAINGTLPDGVTVDYTNNYQTDAGVYRVLATINGGAYYASTSMSATMTIEKAEQSIMFEAIPDVVLGLHDDFQLEASATSGLDVEYEYRYAGTEPAVLVSASGWITIQKVGVVSITAIQLGNSNYKAAKPITQTLRVVSEDTSITEIIIDGDSYFNVTDHVRYEMKCSDLRSKVSIRVKVEEGMSVSPSEEIVVYAYTPGVYKQFITITSQDGSSSKEYTIEIVKPFEFDDIAVQKFKNSLVINNNPKTNGGYELVAFEWFKDGVSVGKEQVYSAGASDLLDGNSVYHAVVTTAAGDIITVCPMTVSVSRNLQIQLYPSPVAAGAMATLNIEGAQSELAGIPIQIYNVQGRLVHRAVLQGGSTAIELPSSLQSGMYMALFELDGTKQTVKFIVE